MGEAERIAELERENRHLHQKFEAAWIMLECVVSVAEDYKKRSADKVLEQSERDRDLEFDMLAKKVHDFSASLFGD